MGNTLSNLLDRAKGVLAGFTLGQKVVTVLAVVGLIAGGVIFSQWASKPTYAPLFSNLPAQDASAIVEKLNGSGTPYQLADGGNTILVPKDQVYATRLQMSGQGLPANDASGYSLLDKEGITASDFRQQIAYQRALEGELSKTIEAISGVRTAVVHLAIPKKDVFADDEKVATAAVLVDMQPGKTITSQQVQAVVHLVSSSVEGLKPEKVTLSDANGKVLSRPGEPGGVDAGLDVRSEQEQAVSDRLQQRAQEMVNRITGDGHAVVKVNAVLDFDQRTTTAERYTQPKNAPAIADSQTTEKYNGNGTGAGGVLGNGVPGLVGTTTGITGTTGAAGTQYDKSTRTRNNALDREVSETKAAAGTVKRLSVAVVIDTKTGGTVDTQQVQDLVSNAVGLDAARGDTIQVGEAAFDNSDVTTAAKELEEARKAESRQTLMAQIRNGVLVGAVALILLFTWLSSRKRRKNRSSEIDPTELAELRRLVEGEVTEQRALQPGGGAVAELEAGTGKPDSGPAQLATVQDEIATMVERQPDEVAQLLRGWLADRRS
jgi:flagellar M-ring protein FliF